jgi:hypothetical protein
LALALRNRRFNFRSRCIAESCDVDLTNNRTYSALCLAYPLPNSLGPWQEPWWRYRRRVLLASKLAERDADDVRHPATPFAEKLLVFHRLPAQRQGVFRTEATPTMIIDFQSFAETRYVVGGPTRSDHAVLVPTRVSQVGDLINSTTIVNTASVKPSLRKEVVYFAGGAQPLRRRVEQVPQ